jgi:hypothetical protein
MKRLDKVSAAVLSALRVLPASGRPGHMSPGEIALALAIVLRARCRPVERLCLASAGMMALDKGARDELIRAAERDRQADDWPFPGVDREVFARVSREHVRQNPLPPAPPGFDPFAETPRARLAHAWSEASDRDRRDLMRRVTGRAAA